MNPRKQFIKHLAEYLAGPNQVGMSIALQANPKNEQAILWCKIRQATPLFGYPTVEEAEEQLTEFLFGKGIKLVE